MIRKSITISAVICLLAAGVFALKIKQDEPHPAELDVLAPKLTGTAKEWRNTNGKKWTIKKGRVTVVDFFTFG